MLYLIGVVVLVALLAVVLYNRLIRTRNMVDNAWSQVDVQLKRRLDLIPNLVESVKGYAAHEKSTFEAVINARNAAVAAPSAPESQAQANNALTGALRQLFALSEAYPDLKANQNFLQLQSRITGLENAITDRREYYNDSANVNNIRIQQFPDALVARMFGFSDARMLEFDAQEIADVDVRSAFGSA